MAEKVIISEIVIKNDWCNLKDNNGREISVFIGTKDGKQSNPTLKEPLTKAKPGDEVEMNVVPGKDGVKLFGWEPKAVSGGSGKSFAPQDKSFLAAQNAAIASATAWNLNKDMTNDKLIETAEILHKWLLSKKSA